MKFLSDSLSGCIGVVVGGGILSMAVIGLCLCGCIVAAIGVGAVIQQQQDDAIADNNGFGTLENPIPPATAAHFQNFSIRPVEYVFDGATHPELNTFRERAAAGSVYTMVWFSLTCTRTDGEECHGNDFQVWLIDEQGRTWEEAPPITVSSQRDLDLMEAIGGSAIRGWQIFEFPQGSTPQRIKLQVGGVVLYTIMPPM